MPQAIGAERCTQRNAARHLRRVRHHHPVAGARPASAPPAGMSTPPAPC